MNLRPYQQAAVDAVFREFEEKGSTLVVLPTGCGKTIVFGHVIHRMPPGRAMVLAHREELIFQAADKITKVTGERPDIEMASSWADQHMFQKARVVVSSIQTQIAGQNGDGRMTRFDPSEFSLLVIDEAHHAVSPSYRRVVEYYRQNPNLKVLGVTATPDRADEEALGQVFESVAFDYEINDAIRDGFLVPIIQRSVVIESLDLSNVRTTAGDLNGADLEKVMSGENVLPGIAHATIEIVGARKALIFTDSVANAEKLAGILNGHRENCARWVCGETPRDERRQLFSDFSFAKYQYMVNVGVATEGYDEPSIECVVMARPTKSRALYAQMVGRGTRPLPGLVDGLSDAEARRRAIAESIKPHVEIIDFVGNAGRHKLMSCADILGGNYSDEVIERAAKKARESAGRPVDALEALREADEELRQERERERSEAERRHKALAQVRARYSTSTIDPFDIFQIEPWRERGWDRGKELSAKQRALLSKQGIDPDSVSYAQGRQLIAEIFARWNKGLCTFKQAKLLKEHGHDTNVSKAKATEIIEQILRERVRSRRAESQLVEIDAF